MVFCCWCEERREERSREEKLNFTLFPGRILVSPQRSPSARSLRESRSLSPPFYIRDSSPRIPPRSLVGVGYVNSPVSGRSNLENLIDPRDIFCEDVDQDFRREVRDGVSPQPLGSANFASDDSAYNHISARPATSMSVRPDSAVSKVFMFVYFTANIVRIECLSRIGGYMCTCK